jgi:hypothetical protein
LLTTLVTGCPPYDEFWEEESPINEGYLPNESVTANQLLDIVLRSYNNSGDAPVLITDNQCPKACYRLHVIPILETGATPRNSIDPQVTDARIVTLTHFDSEHPAESDVTELFHALNSKHTGIGTPISYIDGGEYYTLLLTTYPAAGHYQFRIVFTFSDGSTMTRDTEPLLFY